MYKSGSCIFKNLVQFDFIKTEKWYQVFTLFCLDGVGGRMFAWEDTTNRQTLMIYGQLHVLSSSDPLFSTC